jgi:hypothetical protein
MVILNIVDAIVNDVIVAYCYDLCMLLILSNCLSIVISKIIMNIHIFGTRYSYEMFLVFCLIFVFFEMTLD